MKKHQGLGDKICPECGEKSVHWHFNVVTNLEGKTVEFGYFSCSYCGWRSEYHGITIEEVES